MYAFEYFVCMGIGFLLFPSAATIVFLNAALWN